MNQFPGWRVQFYESGCRTLPSSNTTDTMKEIERLVTTYGNDVLRLATTILGSRDLAEDVHQETFLRVLKAWDRFRGDASEKTWITGIAINVCRDMMRSAWRRRVTVSDEVVGALPDTHSNREMDRLTERSDVMKALNKLSTAHREAIVLFYYHDFDVRQIASLQGVPEGTVKSRLHKARGKLAALMGGDARGE